MTELSASTSSSYLDFNGLTRLKGEAARDPSKAIRQTAEQFEAYFIQQMMKTMRESIEKSDLVEGGNMDMYQDLMDKEISLSVAKRGGMGLANMMERQMTLAQGLPEGSKMDWIVEKAVELGATAIQPLAAARSVVRLSPERTEKKMAHWQGIMAAAAEQCGRNRLPHLAEPADFGQWIRQQDLHRRVLLSPRGSTSLSDWARHHPPQALTILIGPEGGFSDVEESAALAHGALCLTMGERILRTETAGLAALSIVQAHWGSN